MARETVRFATQRPWCPSCTQGYMWFHSITLDTCPEVDASMSVIFYCPKCQFKIEIDYDDPEVKGVIGTSVIFAIAERQGRKSR